MPGPNDLTLPMGFVFDNSESICLLQHQNSSPSGSTVQGTDSRSSSLTASSAGILPQSTPEPSISSLRPPHTFLSYESYKSIDSLFAVSRPVDWSDGSRHPETTFIAPSPAGLRHAATLDRDHELYYLYDVTEDSDEQEGSSPERHPSAEVTTELLVTIGVSETELKGHCRLSL